MKLKLKKIIKSLKENKIIIVGFSFIIVGMIILVSKFLLNEINQKQEIEKIHDFIEEQVVNNKDNSSIDDNNSDKNLKQQEEEKYIAVIEIPKINLKRGIYSKNSVLNNVNKNVQILKDSDFPDDKNGNVILAAHSGTGKSAYFKNLIKLKEGDIVNIYYNNNQYSYKVNNIYEINKTGKMELESHSSSILTLITCNQEDKTKQIVFICKKL